MSYDLCGKTWNDGKDHTCKVMAGHFQLCECSCGAQKFIRDVPLKSLPAHLQPRRRRAKGEKA